MKIHIEHVLKSWHFTVIALCIALMLFAISIIFWKDGNSRVQETISEMTYMKDRQGWDKILSEGNKYLKVTTMYSRIHAVYGKKYHSRYNKKDAWKNQGLKKEIRADFFRLCYEYSRILSQPYFDYIVTSIVETDMNPLARTYWKDGRLKEAGIFQHRKVAVEHAQWILTKVLPANLRSTFSFKFENMEDLFDPINALKISALLYYGAKSSYRGDPSWYVTSVHWGANRIMPYYRNGLLPPKAFIFNKGTVKEDVRNPFTYYFYWNSYKSQFENFTTKVFVDKSWSIAYKKACTKLEWQFIHSQKYVRQIMESIEELNNQKIKFEELRIKQIKQLENKISQVNNTYRELNGLIKRGKFSNIKDVFKQGRALFNELGLEIKSKEIAKTRKLILIVLFFISFIFLCFSIIGISSIIKKVISLLKQ